MSKYNNKKTIVDGITFDSIKESNRYIELKALERIGEIKDLELQPVFKYLSEDGKRVLFKYIADSFLISLRETVLSSSTSLIPS